MKTIYLGNVSKRLMAQSEKYLKLRKQRGMTLLEIIIVLGIIGTIAAGVVILAQRAYDNKAISDLVSNTSTVRTAIKETYGPSGVYPAVNSTDTLFLTESGIKTSTAPIAVLIQLGKLSSSESKNNVSSNFFNVGGARVGTAAAVGGTNPANKAFFVEVNGLDQKQCRNVLLQAGNQWDFVNVVITGGGAGSYTQNAAPDLSATALSTLATTSGGAGGILRSLATGGTNVITPQNVIAYCSDSANNSIVLGSR
ncbi:type IV pilus major pilin [Salmonella enterica]|nr:type IV pilus major pilin [Salmonella enterica]